MKLTQTRPGDSLTRNQLSPTSRSITRVFATAALVQMLTMSTNGLPGSSIYAAVARAIDALKRLSPSLSKRGLVWPICVAGSMAAADQEPFFESIMSSVLQDGAGGHSSFGNCETVLRVMREAWEARRRTQEAEVEGKIVGAGWGWRRAMGEMGICALLV